MDVRDSPESDTWMVEFGSWGIERVAKDSEVFILHKWVVVMPEVGKHWLLAARGSSCGRESNELNVFSLELGWLKGVQEVPG